MGASFCGGTGFTHTGSQGAQAVTLPVSDAFPGKQILSEPQKCGNPRVTLEYITHKVFVQREMFFNLTVPGA